MKKTMTGFTIVELLIVIVVIAILATISIVAYNGIQNRANDTAIQSDLNNFAKKVHLAAATTGEFPAGGASRTGTADSGDSTAFPGFSFTPSKGAYMSSVHNLFYCTGTDTVSGQKIFRIMARSKSGNTFRYRSDGSIQSLGSVGFSQGDACQGMNNPQTWSYGFMAGGGGTWWGWTN